VTRPRRVNWAILGPGIALVAILVAILASGFGNDPHAVPSMLEGRGAPQFTTQTLDDAKVDLASLRGSPVVLNFWSTWCQPCRLEHPYLQAAARAFPDVKFFGVLYSDDPAKARRYLQQNDSAYPILLDPGGRMAIDYGVTGVPETFFIDKEGRIRHKFNGPLPPDVLQTYITELRAP
jgi:cytochrome c biogenesis protein CcmG, thiol:disulfide interchange protein DsbE